jgi:CDP-2,3-bis-(O-geranylgeranyl)-sn-glycerol synthase
MIPESASEAMRFTPDPLACAAFLTAAFVLAGLAHVFWLRSKASEQFCIPLDGGLTLAGKRIFGNHKMLRGFMVISPAAGLSFALLFLAVRFAAPESARLLWQLPVWQYTVIGFLAGFGFMAGELPNSFVKRRLGIPPGGAPANPFPRAALFLADRMDSILGMMLVLSLVVPVPPWTWVYVFVTGIGLHWIFSAVLFAFRVKERMA